MTAVQQHHATLMEEHHHEEMEKYPLPVWTSLRPGDVVSLRGPALRTASEPSSPEQATDSLFRYVTI